MEFTIEEIEDNKNFILNNIFNCTCNSTLQITDTIYDEYIVMGYECMCPSCKNKYSVKINIEEL